MHAQSCCFANQNLFPFSRSRCHRCRRRGRKLQDGNFSLWNPKSENFCTWNQEYSIWRFHWQGVRTPQRRIHVYNYYI